MATDFTKTRESKLRWSRFTPYAKWALLPVLMAVPVVSEIIDSVHQESACVFRSDLIGSLICIEVIFLGVIGVYVTRRESRARQDIFCSGS